MALEADITPNESPLFDIESINMQELRLTIIGNDELKLQLMKNRSFLLWIHQKLALTYRCLHDSNIFKEEDITAMLELIVILWLLFLVDRLLADLIDSHSLGECVAVLAKTTELILSRKIDSCSSATLPVNTAALKECITYSFFIMLSFENYLSALTKYVSAARLWRFPTELVSSFDKDPNLWYNSCLVAALRLVPFLLDQKGNATEQKAAEDEAAHLLNVVFQSLRNKTDQFWADDHLIDDSNGLKAEKFHGVPLRQILGTDLSFSATAGLLITAAQILNYFENLGEKGASVLSEEYAYKENEFFQSILGLYGPHNSDLINVALLNISRLYLSCLQKEKLSDEMIINTAFEYLFPRINWILENNNESFDNLPKYIRRPIAVLSDLCLTYPEACMRIKNSNVDSSIMANLNELFSCSKGFKFLHNLKLQAGKEKQVVDFTSSNTLSWGYYIAASDTQMDNIADHVLLLSVYTSVMEDCRRRVTDHGTKKSGTLSPNFLCFLVCEVVENYQFLCLQLLLNQVLFRELKASQQSEKARSTWDWLGRNLGQLLFLIQHPIYAHTFYLIRSLSRSVSSVETFFVDCNSIKSTYDYYQFSALKVSSDVTFSSVHNTLAQRYDASSRLDSTGTFLSCILSFIASQKSVGNAVTFFSSAKEGYLVVSERVRKRMYDMATVILGCIANFCLDFGPFRKLILDNDRFLKDLSKLFQRSSRDRSDLVKEERRAAGEKVSLAWHEISYEQLQMQIGIFQIIQNLLYNETEENRRAVWEHIPLTIVFEKSLYGISVAREADPEVHKLLLKLKIIAFAIMRNLTVNSAFFCKYISGIYKKYVSWQDDTLCRIPPSWKDYLLENLLAFDLYVDVERGTLVDRTISYDDEFYIRLLKVPEYHGLFVAINYLEDNCHINISNFRTSDFPSDGMMRYWKRILQIKLLLELERQVCGHNSRERISFSVKLVDAKLAIVWNLINLLFEEGNRHSRVPGDDNDSVTDSGQHRVRINPAGAGSGDQIELDTNSLNEEELEPSMPPKVRAQQLFELGFDEILVDLIYQMSVPWRRYLSSGKNSLLQRFDNINSNDLLDKLKTAYRQILVLGYGASHEQVDMDFKGVDGEGVEFSVMDSIAETTAQAGSPCTETLEDHHPFSDDDIEPWIR